MKNILIGKKNKRFDYFEKACRDVGVDFDFIDINNFNEIEDNHYNIKIDPIENKTIYLSQLNQNIKKYLDTLDRLSNLKKSHFLNTPNSIISTLDKIKCKTILQSNNILTTPMLDFTGQNFDELIEYLSQRNISQIFIKPNYSSGASGILALRYNKKLNSFILQTSLYKEKNEFINTKRTRRFTDKNIVEEYVDFVLGLGAIVEVWIPKDDFNGLTYDLRVMYQFGKIVFVQARGTKNNPITNLHLNNMPIEINISDEKLQDISDICKSAISKFEGLKSVGFDILIEKNSKNILIIEMNAQGDLMYKDIYNENIIYKQQAQMMENKWKY